MFLILKEPTTDRVKREHLKKMGKSCDSFFYFKSDDQDDQDVMDLNFSAVETTKEDISKDKEVLSKDKEEKPESKNLKGEGGSREENEERPHSRLGGDKDSEKKEDWIVENSSELQVEVKDKKDKCSNKTLHLISKLQTKKEDLKEKEKKNRTKTDSKTKDLISKLRGQAEKDDSKEKDKEKSQKMKDSKIRGMFSKVEEKQKELRGTEMKKKRNNEKDKERENTQSHRKRSSVQDKTQKDSEKETERNPNKYSEVNNVILENSSRDERLAGEVKELMFDELLEQVRKDDPLMTELNVNNSDVIKTHTLIQFAEAQQHNTRQDVCFSQHPG